MSGRSRAKISFLEKIVEINKSYRILIFVELFQRKLYLSNSKIAISVVE